VSASDGLPAAMAALVCHEDGALVVERVPVPELGPGDALVRISHCGICGTDLHHVAGRLGHGPLVLGHEYSGVVAAVGEDVEGWVPGDRVVGGPGLGCGACPPCRAGTPHLCRVDPVRGGAGNGSWATFRRVAAGQLFRVPHGLDLRTAALTEPLAIALRAVRRGGVQPGDRVLVTGAGSIGMLAVAFLVELGAEVTVSEPSAVRRERALRIGAREAWEPGPTAVPGGPYAAVVECSGRAEVMEQAVGSLARGGTMVLVGIGAGSRPAFDARQLTLTETTVTGSVDYSRAEFAEALAVLAAGRLPVDDLLEPGDVPLDEVATVVPRLTRGEIAGKVLVAPGSGLRGER
jgi:(R,R)-butanediol dehydrogenase/meso-butanediol dehydrogenase/diacetyl reductase